MVGGVSVEAAACKCFFVEAEEPQRAVPDVAALTAAAARGELRDACALLESGHARHHYFEPLGGSAEGRDTDSALGAGSGEVGCQVDDTYGGPSDTPQRVIEERGDGLDEGGVQVAMEQQRQQSEDARTAAELQARMAINQQDNQTAMALAQAEIDFPEEQEEED